MTKTQICSVISDQCPISNSDSWVFLDSMSEITDFNEFHKNKIRWGQKWVIEKTSLSWFKPFCVDMSKITDWWKRGGQTKL